MNAGDYKSAMAAFKQFYSIDSAILNKEKSKTMFELEAKYEAEKKDLEIANLSQQASIKDLEIKQKNQALIIVLFAVLFIAGFIYLMYRQRALKSMQKQTALEQRFLRSQLNPHFMSNALMAIQSFMLKNQADKAATYLAKFAKLMREILENSRKEFILVEDEIQMLTNYLDIHRVRMNESFDYTIEVNENIDTATDAIPPMFVQPFIENAIEHGIINAKAQGMIKLKLTKEGDYISIEITDNGGGMIQQKQELKEHTSLSTAIIQERMALLNKSLKKKIELVWENILNERGEVNGTKVELKVPYSYL
jgi:LytS/YehU family sensor histidine kinase